MPVPHIAHVKEQTGLLAVLPARKLHNPEGDGKLAEKPPAHLCSLSRLCMPVGWSALLKVLALHGRQP